MIKLEENVSFLFTCFINKSYRIPKGQLKWTIHRNW